MPLFCLRGRFALIVLVSLLPAAPAAAQVLTVLHSFSGGPNDGKNPGGSLALSGSTLFGMTSSGGSVGPGTVFQIGTDGTGFGLLHSFAGGLSDGQNPTGSLALSGANLYGMTQGGGSASDGVVFKVGADGSGFGLLHSFTGGPTDGSGPLGSPIQSGATLCGMTFQGGAANVGTIYRMNTDGTAFSLLHSFAGGPADGQDPGYSSLVKSGSTLYGMTITGGATGFGTVFKVNTDGTGFALLHSFDAAGGDAWAALGSLTLSGSTLYGMTRQGGGGAGAIFKINTDGTGYGIMHIFAGQPGDGAAPVGTLTAIDSVLYGTTPLGGADNLGTIFEINDDGTGYATLYSFTGGPNDGANPGDLTLAGTTLYGITGAGGASNLGTIFSFTPVPEPSALALLGAAAAFGRWRRIQRSR